MSTARDDEDEVKKEGANLRIKGDVIVADKRVSSSLDKNDALMNGVNKIGSNTPKATQSKGRRHRRK